MDESVDFWNVADFFQLWLSFVAKCQISINQVESRTCLTNDYVLQFIISFVAE